MKLSLAANIFSGILILYMGWSCTNGQYFEDPKIFFKPFEMDSALRGAWNLSSCIQEMMLCWELVRSDVLCHERNRTIWSDTVCPIVSMYCHEYNAHYDANVEYIRFNLYEVWCPKWIGLDERLT